MDSSNAAREAYIAFHEGLSGFDAARAWDDMTSPADDWSQEAIDWEYAIKAALSSRDAEVAELTGVIDSSARTYEELESEHTAALEALAESRARFGDSEARRAELEAAIQAVRDLADKAEHGALRWADPLPVPEWVPRVRAVLSEPSVVLEDRDRENRAIGWDEGFDAWFVKDLPRDQTINPYRGDNR